MSSILDSLRSTLPQNWDNHLYWDSSEDMHLVELSESSSEFENLKSKITKNVTKIVRVENPYLWLSYQLKKEECVKRNPATEEREMWHVTCPSYIESIARYNFDWRRSCRARYGQGVCFSPDLSHALRWSTYDGAVILAKVLVGNICDGDWGLELPPEGCDTSTGWGDNVYVRFMDNEFYPVYVAYYS